MPNTGKQSKPPKHAPDAVATQWGWLHKKTGEQLVSVRDLPNQQTGYKPNARPQATPPSPPPPPPGGSPGHSPAPPRPARSTRSGGGTVQPPSTPGSEDEEISVP